MHRFYYDFSIIKKEEIKAITIREKDVLNQMISVLRFRVGDSIILFNGKDSIDYIYKISKIEKNQIELDYREKITKEAENTFDINLYQAIPNKLDKIEYILQKGVEVGISKFVIFISDRSQKLILSENKIERLKKIIIEAVEQSGRNTLPELVILDKKLDIVDNKSLNLYFHTSDKNSIYLKEIEVGNKKEVNLFVGPEGGFSEREIEEFREKGFSGVFLGNRILRTETVGSVVGFYLKQK